MNNLIRTLVKLGLRNKTVFDKLVMGSKVYAGLDNPMFINPNPARAFIKSTNDNLRSAVDSAVGGSDLDKAKLKVAVYKWNIMMNAAGAYVQGLADNDYANAAIIIAAANMDKRRGREKNPLPLAVEIIDAIFTNQPGTILVEWKSAKYARSYQLYMSTTPEIEASWIIIDTTTKRKLLVENLSSGVRYYFRVVTVGSSGKSYPSHRSVSNICM